MSDKIVTLEELRAHSTKNDLYMLISEKVYNVTKFLDEHPGGDEVILSEAGKDATEAFEDVGHSDEARALLPDMLVGEFEKNSGIKQFSVSVKEAPSAAASKAVEQGSNFMYFLPLAFLAAYFGYRMYTGAA